MRRGFTLVELVMVVIILGIISSIGAEIISSLYDNYIKSRTINRLESQTNIALELIAKRFSRRVKNSTSIIRGTTRIRVENGAYDDKIIEWIGISDESFRGDWNGSQVVAGWSGFIDLGHENTNSSTADKSLFTSGSNLDFARNTILALSYGKLDMEKANGKLPAIIQKAEDDNISRYYGSADGSYTVRVSKKRDYNETLFLQGHSLADYDGNGARDVYEQYYLSHTAYALVPAYGNPIDRNDFNLTLHYNYRPWEGEARNDAKISVIAEHVQKFRLSQKNGVVWFTLCLRDNALSTASNSVRVCKEKVVLK